ncbi:MAG: D-glycerate dehydrogenase [Proteobacteria bacterium]|nr:D-glycerate dehydrogenase [Pseudomonadota bacterium]MDA1285838.1 D-glycerate dehydrogenase [Pseudomonadota bacterium]
MKPSLLITRPLPAPVIDAARAVCDVTVAQNNDPWPVAATGWALAQYDAILATLGDTFSAPAFAAQPATKCRLLANFGVGYNHIDVVTAAGHGIAVTNTPGVLTDATADMAITLMLMTARRAGEGERMLRAGKWPGWHPTQMLGMHVTGKTLGVIGMGRIGQAVARRAHFGFGMDVVFFNRSKVLDCGIPGARQLVSMAEVMAQSDVVSVNVPGAPENHHLISADVLAAAKPGTIIVNTARGDVIDEAALISALKSGALAGAGLDVYEHEPHVPDDLIAMENVVLLPHMGTNALEVRTKMGLIAVENIKAFFEGRELPNRV